MASTLASSWMRVLDVEEARNMVDTERYYCVCLYIQQDLSHGETKRNLKRNMYMAYSDDLVVCHKDLRLKSVYYNSDDP